MTSHENDLFICTLTIRILNLLVPLSFDSRIRLMGSVFEKSIHYCILEKSSWFENYQSQQWIDFLKTEPVSRILGSSERASPIFEKSIHYCTLETTSGFKFQIISSLIMEFWGVRFTWFRTWFDCKVSVKSILFQK